MPFVRFSKAQLKKKHEGIYGAILEGERMQLTRVHLEHGVATGHSHPHEQMGYILSGEVEITIGHEKRLCSDGDAYQIPSNLPHGFKPVALEGVDYIEIFSPPKKENQSLGTGEDMPRGC